jgi:Concanavalin A-like lectin/glucanases superfamily
MKTSNPFFRGSLFQFGFLMLVACLFAMPAAGAGLTFELDIYVQNQGQSYVFYTPLFTNSMSPDAPLGSYFISSPQWPTNGATRAFDLTASGLGDHVPNVDSESGFNDFESAVQGITNGAWTILFTNATTTNFYMFTVSASNINSNTLPVTIATFPADGSIILTNQTTFTWQGPTNWAVNGEVDIFGDDYFYANPPAAQSSWTIPGMLQVDTGYTFYLHYVTNYASPVFVATTPLSTNTLQPISGWATSNVFETGSSVNFAVASTHGTPSQGHTCLAYYSFEDNNLFAHDFSGNGNTMTYAWFSVPPYIVTNDTAAGMYAGGFGGSGWFTPPDSMRNLFAGSFSVSLWLKTTNVSGFNNGDQYSAAGIVSDLSGDYNNAAMPMGQTGSKLAFYTGGSSQNLLRSQADINTGQYVHVVTTRDQQTGEKRIYINGVLDSSVYAASDLLNGSSPGGLTIGYNNGQVFAGEMDEIQFYSGVLSSNDVAFLHNHPGTNVADTLELGVPVARFDFEDTNSPGIDSSGHNNNANCSSSSGDQEDMASTNAAVGTYARQYFGDTYICFSSGGSEFAHLSNALSSSFSVTAWVNTTNSINDDFANAYFGLPILFAYGSDTNSTIPLSITGSKAAFTIYDENGMATTIHSLTTVNDGKYHFIAVTRNQSSGLMSLYVDGNLEATNTSTTQSLVIPTFYLAGGWYVAYQGLLDDVRIYAGELDANDVAILAGVINSPLGMALDSPALPWTTSGDSSWFVETTNTYDGVSAAQSGVLTDNSQYSSLQTTVTGPGILTFWWDAAYDDDFDLEFDIDGGYGIFNDYDDFTGNEWTQDTFTIPSGMHTLTWFAYNADSTNDTGWVDQVVFTTATAVTVLNPQVSDDNFQFCFLSQNGFTHTIQYCTDLTLDDWQTYSTITGDGTFQNIQIPISFFDGSSQGYVRVLTSVSEGD